MKTKTKLFGLGALLLAGLALAQSYSTFSYLRVLNDAEVLGDLTVTGTCTGCGGAGGTPGGADTQVQYNDGGAFGGDAGLTFNETTNALTVTGDVDAATFDGVAMSNIPRLASSNTFTGQIQHIQNSGGPLWNLDDSDASLNERNWIGWSNSGQFILAAWNDAQNSTTTTFACNRTAMVIDDCTMFADLTIFHNSAGTERGRFSSSGALQVTGSFGSGFASAHGLELGISAGSAYVQSYDRNASAYMPLVLTGSTINALYPSGTVGPVLPLYAIKGGATARNTTATPAADPDLTLTFPVAGRYQWDIYLVMSDVSNGSADFKFDFGTTGTVLGVGTTSMYYWWETAVGTSGAMQLNGTSVYMGYMGTTLGTDVTVQATSSDTRLHIWGVGNVSASATLTFNWAQAVSNGSNVTVAAGSLMTARFLGP